MSCRMALLRGLIGGLAGHWWMTLVLVLFPLAVRFTRGTYMLMPIFHQMSCNLDTGQTQKDGIDLLFFCLTSLFANLLARIPSVCHAAQICKPPSQSKKYLRPPLPEKIFSLLSRKFVRHISTLHCLLRGVGNSPTPKQSII